MAEVELPPIQPEPELPEEQLPEVEKPTEKSKVISVNFSPLNTKQTENLDTRGSFFTTDTDAWIVLKIDDMSEPTGQYSLALMNKQDGSIFQKVGDIVEGVAYYKLLPNEIKHAGRWFGQAVITLPNGQTTASRFIFTVSGHILDGKDVREIVIQDFQTLMKQLNDLKDNGANEFGLLKGEIEDFQTIAQENENERKSAELERVAAEIRREESYESKVDAAIVEADVVEKVDNKVAELAPTIQNVTAQLAQTEQELNARVSETIANAGDGTLPTEVVDMRTVGGKSYTVAGDALRAIAEGDAIKKGAITPEKISDSHLVDSVNIFDKNKAISGEYYSAYVVGDPVSLKTGDNWYRTPSPISVSPGDVVRFNKAYMNGYYQGVDDDGVLRQVTPIRHTVSYTEVIVAEGVTKFYTAIYTPTIDEAMITINNPMPTEYVSHKIKGTKILDWLEHKPKSVTMETLNDDVINRFSSESSVISGWGGSEAALFGDSIQWQDGKAYSSIGLIARGMGTIIKDKLGLSLVDNKGVSGAPMANGTANGAGTNTVIRNYTLFPSRQLVKIAAGTNDFKLNVPIGTIGDVDDTIFDNTTYIGAYRESIEFILKANPKARIVLFTPLQRNNGGYNSWNTVNTAGHKLVDYVEAIKAIGRMYSLHVVDLFAKSGFNKFTLATYTMDGLHPNDEGYQIMGEIGAREILSNVAPPKAA